MDSKIRVVVVDDSIVFRNFLINTINQDSRYEVVGYAINAADARQKIPQLKPDVVTCDIEMPGMTGMEFLKDFLPKYPVPVVLVSTLDIRMFDALAVGAIDFVRKPDISSSYGKEAFGRHLLTTLENASKAKVKLPSANAPVMPAPTKTTLDRLRSKKDMVIAIGASTGGTEAILAVLKNLPPDMPGIVVTQHMPEGFTKMYAERLNRICKLEVREAKSGDQIRPGLVLLAPGGKQMRVVRLGTGYAVNCTVGEKVSGHMPSVDVLFDSVSSVVRSKAIGVILTGMGADGAMGLLRMRKNGAYTIGQDKESCVVYGMPMEAYKIGAVAKQAALQDIPQLLIKQLSER